MRSDAAMKWNKIIIQIYEHVSAMLCVLNVVKPNDNDFIAILGRERTIIW